MKRFIKDINVKIELKNKSNKNLLLGYIKAFLDVTIWIVFIYRISNFFVAIRMYPLGKLFWLINRILFSVDIDPRANLAGGFVLIHGLNVVVGHEVCSLGILKVYQGVTIGGNMGKRIFFDGIESGQPLIQNNVTLGIGSKILGPVVVGENSLIGTNTIITKDVLPNCIMIGNNKILRETK